jgi:YggT family protein
MPHHALLTVFVATANSSLQGILRDIVWVIIFALIIRALLSWFPAEPGTQLYGVVRALDRFTEPILRPIRRLMPPLRFGGGGGIDLSLFIVIILLQVVVIDVLIPAL